MHSSKKESLYIGLLINLRRRKNVHHGEVVELGKQIFIATKMKFEKYSI